MDTPKHVSPLPQLPADLDDPDALDRWYCEWNAWIANEAAKRNWPWLKPMTPAMLHEIVERETKRRSYSAHGTPQEELSAARGDLNALEAHLRATDSQYEAKRALLVPILQPIFKHIPPSNWSELFEQAYARTQVPVGSPTQDPQRELLEGRNALTALENRLRVQDPAYETKKALLTPILKPVFMQLPPSKWATAFEQAYASTQLPVDTTAEKTSTTVSAGQAIAVSPRMSFYESPRAHRTRITSFAKVTWWLQRAAWWMMKKRDERRKLTNEQAAALQGYYTKAMNIFRTLQIDLDSKPVDKQRLYLMMLLYVDEEEIVCPAAARTASLVGFLDTLGTGWALPPTSVAASKEFAKEVDGYVAVELFRNHLGLKDIRDEIVNAMNSWKRPTPSSQIAMSGTGSSNP